MCEEGGDAACPAEVEAERNREETQLCYKQPCPGTEMDAFGCGQSVCCATVKQGPVCGLMILNISVDKKHDN